MLQRINIENYVLIDRASIDLADGLSVITGETGSGKSVLMGALNLILGERADLDVLRSSESKCIIEASFLLNEGFEPFFAAHDLDYDKETIVRREISPSGKSRAFINDTPVTLKVLKEFGSELVDIHSQMETSRLRDRAFRFEMLDGYAGQLEEVRAWQRDLAAYRQAQKDLEDLLAREAQSKADEDYYRFQLDELEVLDLEGNDFEALEEEAATQQHADTIVAALARVAYALDESDEALVPELKQLVQALAASAEHHLPSKELHERLQSTLIELQDIASEAADARDRVSRDPERQAEVEKLLDQIYAVQSKHRLNSVAELKALRNELREKLADTEQLEDQIKVLSNSIVRIEKGLKTTAQGIHAKREKAGKALEQGVASALESLKMPHARLAFVLRESEEFNQHGCSELQLLFTANKGAEALPLEKSASGGELSRLMLALKSVVASFRRLPTLILDEIDTGVSGDVAARMAEMMQAMSGRMQLIAISHLPQVAGKARHHLKVSKEVVGELTYTRIRSLHGDARIEELAGMLSGAEITDTARDHARSLLA